MMLFVYGGKEVINMKLKDNLILREVAGQYVIVPIGKRVQEVTSLVYISASAAYLWDYMKDNEFTVDDLVKKIVDHYEGVTEEVARKDIESYIKLLTDNFIIDDGRTRGFVTITIPKEKMK